MVNPALLFLLITQTISSAQNVLNNNVETQPRPYQMTLISMKKWQ